MPKEPDNYASLEETRAVLVQLTQNMADMLRLKKIARLRVRGLQLTEGTDLLNTAIVRVLEGTRRWPRHVSFIAFMAGVMRSIANEERKQILRIAEIIIRPTGRESGHREDDIANIPNRNPGPDRPLHAEQAWAAVMALFKDDEEARAILEKRSEEGYSSEETQNMLGMTPERYATVLKRIRRKLNQLPPDDYTPINGS